MGIIHINNLLNMSTAISNNTGNVFACNMNGYTDMVMKILSLVLAAFTIGISTIEGVISFLPDLGQAIRLTYEFLLSAGDWIGYVMAAIYFLAMDQGWGSYLCQASQYGYYVIYYLQSMVSMGQSA